MKLVSAEIVGGELLLGILISAACVIYSYQISNIEIQVSVSSRSTLRIQLAFEDDNEVTVYLSLGLSCTKFLLFTVG